MTAQSSTTIRDLMFKQLGKFRLDIEKALVYGGNTHTFADVVESLISGERIAHFLPNSVIICELAVYPQHKAYHIFLAAGDLDELVTFQPALEEAAKILGCAYLTLSGRLGWKPVLQKTGWTASTLIMAKEIDHG